MAAPIARYPSEEPLLDRRPRRLNTITEEESNADQSPERTGIPQRAGRKKAKLQIQSWLSPMSDHFPTPRGNHYLSAPILPSSPSTVSTDEADSPATSSNRWNRASVGSDNTDFDDLYDVSDSEDDLPRRTRSSRSKHATGSPKQQRSRQPVPIVIPSQANVVSEPQRAADDLKKLQSPVAVTPSLQLCMSPAQLNFMDHHKALSTPTSSAPPSLDGSLTSEQLAMMSAPPTPVEGDEDATDEDVWAGVELQPGALATLQSLSNSQHEDLQEQPSGMIEIGGSPAQPMMEMREQATGGFQPLRLFTTFPQSTTRAASWEILARPSPADLSRLDIPSPGGFFSALSPHTRTTWHAEPSAADEAVPPTSTTAEHFYRCPWNEGTNAPPVPQLQDSAEGYYRNFASSSSFPVEQVIEVRVAEDVEDDLPTARPTFEHKDSDETVKAPASPEIQDAPTEIIADYDPEYAKQQQQEALSNLDRTDLWLRAQRAYLRGVVEETDDQGVGEKALNTIEEEPEEQPKEAKLQNKSTTAEQSANKVVRFSNVIATTVPKRLPSMLARQESAFYRAFQAYIVRAQQQDVFVHALARFESLQAQRNCLRESHRNQLLGKYQLKVVPQSAKKRLSTNVVRGDDKVVDDPEKLRIEKEVEAMNQTMMATWHVAAVKFLNGGRLISAPVTKRLARLSQIVPTKKGDRRERTRILDLGGQATCDWAWHCALQYPNAKVYSVTTKSVRQISNANVRGPFNHRQVAVDKLSRLPFADNQFDLLSARELHSLLKFTGENGEDEWETCLRECMRVLKPGGYLEFSLLDSDIMNAGPLGLAKSVEFGFGLKTLGYDPTPTKLWLGRLSRAGFEGIRRSWICLPVGSKCNPHKPPTPPTYATVGKVCQMDAIVMGSTDNIANVCSIVGSWSWERWLLRCEMEKVAGELRLQDTVTAGVAMREAGKCLEGVARVMEEGRNCRAGFRMLNGFAMKPAAVE